MNLAKLSKTEYQAMLDHKKFCLRLYYENKDMYAARMFHNKLKDDRKIKAARAYAKSINEVKGYPALKID
jgi:hypothetical protein